MIDPFEAFARRHRLSPEASADLQRLVVNASGVGNRRALLAAALAASEPPTPSPPTPSPPTPSPPTPSPQTPAPAPVDGDGPIGPPATLETQVTLATQVTVGHEDTPTTPPPPSAGTQVTASEHADGSADPSQPPPPAFAVPSERYARQGVAAAYAAWRGGVDGLPWRLPHEWAWEKAARGVDGRWFATGDHLDPTRANIAASRPGPSSILAVTATPTDESVYGVRGLNRNVRDFCGNAYARQGPSLEGGRLVGARPPGEDDFVTVRGGSFVSMPNFCRAATRFGLRPHQPLAGLGFRLVRSL